MLSSKPLCNVSIHLDPDAPLPLGRSPWRNRRVSYISGGRVEGERLNGIVREGGGDWSELGIGPTGDALTYLDVRSVWQTDDEALIYVTYTGRLVVPAALLPSFRDSSQIDTIDPSSYYFRIAPLFETADERYSWLNGLLAVGIGRRTLAGVDYEIHQIS